jgi:hypothetical protein
MIRNVVVVELKPDAGDNALRARLVPFIARNARVQSEVPTGP